MSEAVVDMAAIESQKENILPLPQGRSAAALVQALDSQQEPAKDSTDDQLKARKERDFEQRLAAVTGEEDDPLEPFVAYVTWVQSAYPSGRSAALMKTVEKCVRRFKYVCVSCGKNYKNKNY